MVNQRTKTLFLISIRGPLTSSSNSRQASQRLLCVGANSSRYLVVRHDDSSKEGCSMFSFSWYAFSTAVNSDIRFESAAIRLMEVDMTQNFGLDLD